MDISEVFSGLVQKLVDVLPVSPFIQFKTQIGNIPYLNYFNWFFPVPECLAVLLAWLGVISFFYLYSVLMRWVKLLSD